ncbi:hypothetical protein AB0395_39755 [Streptosporangium sp. NPDC051023]|uniref:hypothetical protein n=1 Tax=Streptosporangium sp. NPDC051023 TaxID=3155410 RepID=UPI00344E2FBA
MFNDTWVKALSNTIALNLADTTPGTYKGALFTGSATPNMSQTNPAYGTSPWSTGNESSGPGYTAGGVSMTVTSFAELAGATNKIGWKFSTISWTSTTITAEGLLVYVPGLSSRAVIFRWFGQPYLTSDGDFQVAFHTDGILREKLRANP